MNHSLQLPSSRVRLDLNHRRQMTSSRPLRLLRQYSPHFCVLFLNEFYLTLGRTSHTHSHTHKSLQEETGTVRNVRLYRLYEVKCCPLVSNLSQARNSYCSCSNMDLQYRHLIDKEMLKLCLWLSCSLFHLQLPSCWNCNSR